MTPTAGGRYAIQQVAAGGGGGFSAPAWGTVMGEYDFSDTAKITATAGAVSSVAPTSGTAGPITNGGVGTRSPTTGTRTAPNGQNVLDFTVSMGQQRLESAAFGQAQPVTVVFVAQYDIPASSGPQMFGDAPALYTSTSLGANRWTLYASGAAPPVMAADASWHVFVAVFNGASSQLWMDGQLVQTGANPGTAGVTSLVVGNYGPGGYGFDGGIAHSIWYQGVVADIPGMSAALITKWALPLTPAGLPGVVGHFDASVTSALVAAGGMASQWSNLRSAAHLLQATGTLQYRTGTTTRNGRNVLDIASGVAWMEATGLVYSGTAFTIIYVGTWQPSGPWGRGMTAWGGGAPSFLEWIVISGGPDVYWRLHQAEYAGAVTDPQSWGMYVARRNGTVLDVWKDGVKAPSAVVGAGVDTYTAFTLGTDDTRTSPTAGATQHGELILSNQAISDAQIAALRTQYVIPKWATP